MKQIMKIYGIYCLTSPSGKKYIGQSMDIKRRLTQYKRGENKNQTKIYNAICKYGWDSMIVEELFTINSSNKIKIKIVLNILEQYFIKKYDSVLSGYNLTYGGDSFLLSEETKSKISKGKLGQGKGIMKNNKVIEQYNKKGQLIKVWDAINYAAEALQIAPSNISLVCRGKRKSAGGFIWKYHKSDD